MKVSIITVAYNCEHLISQTLDSITSQDYNDLEYIVVDGDSEDNTLEVIRTYSDRFDYIKVISEPDNGLYEAMNKGLNMASGDIIGILNAGDFYTSNSILSLVANKFKNLPDLDSIYGDLEYIKPKHEDKVIRYWYSGQYNVKKFYKGWMPPHPTFFVKRTVYEKYGYFDTDLKISADYELMLRFLLKNKISALYIPKVMVKMPVGGKSNASIRNRLLANMEDRKAWGKNELKPKFYTVTWKPLSKIIQFFKRSKSIFFF